jgi:leucyl-tRNA synthetase
LHDLREKITLCTAPAWKTRYAELAADSAAGRRLNMASPSVAPYKKDAPKNAQKLAKQAHSLSAEGLGLDEFETLSRESAYLASAFGVPVEVCSADQPGADPKGKSKQAEPGRPAIWIE